MKEEERGTNSTALSWFRSVLREQKTCRLQSHMPALKDYSEEVYP